MLLLYLACTRSGVPVWSGLVGVIGCTCVCPCPCSCVRWWVAGQHHRERKLVSWFNYVGDSEMVWLFFWLVLLMAMSWFVARV